MFIISSMILIVIILALSIMWNFCIPDGCVFSVRAECGTTECMGESVSDHIQERIDLFSVPTSPTILSLLTIILLIACLSWARQKFSYKSFRLLINNTPLLNFEPKLFDPILDALSNGRLNPKIYPSH